MASDRHYITGGIEALRALDRSTRRGQVVGVVTGGRSSEREISLKTGAGLERALRELGYEPRVYDVPRDLVRLVQERPDAVLLGIHGGAGENGVIQGFLEALGVDYTGSGVLASALAMDKGRAKAVLDEHKVPVPRGIRLSGVGELDFESINAELDLLGLELPLVIKPNDEGSSVGVSICREETDFAIALDALWNRDVGEGTPAILVEQFLDGPEYTVGFFDGVCLGAIEVRPAEGFYDFRAKYQSDQTRYVPVQDARLAAQLEALGRDAYSALGCRGVARVDIKAHTPLHGASHHAHEHAHAPVDLAEPGEDGDELYVLEVNTIPGMTATSLVPKLVQAHGISYADFSEMMLVRACRDMDWRLPTAE